MVFSKFVPDVRVCQLYDIVPIVAVADTTLVNAGGISFGQSVVETCPMVPQYLCHYRINQVCL